jgi:MinD superfamily P-loop ATPase
VDAPDLHLLLQPARERTEEFYSGHEAHIDHEICTFCDLCATLCQFGAIRQNGGWPVVDPLRCEGCKVCVAFCPVEAIRFPEKHCGHWYISSTRFGPLVHAQLFPGAENSGRLVMVLKQQARELAKARRTDLILCDGAPGIGCPVISSLSGTHLAVAVTEPTPSGRHDLERVADLCRHFQIPLAVIINKFDLNQEETRRIGTYCQERDYPVVAHLPHDPVVIQAMIRGLVVTEMPATEMSRELARAWTRLEALAGLAPSQGRK